MPACSNHHYDRRVQPSRANGHELIGQVAIARAGKHTMAEEQRFVDSGAFARHFRTDCVNQPGGIDRPSFRDVAQLAARIAGKTVARQRLLPELAPSRASQDSLLVQRNLREQQGRVVRAEIERVGRGLLWITVGKRRGQSLEASISILGCIRKTQDEQAARLVEAGNSEVQPCDAARLHVEQPFDESVGRRGISIEQSGPAARRLRTAGNTDSAADDSDCRTKQGKGANRFLVAIEMLEQVALIRDPSACVGIESDQPVIQHPGTPVRKDCRKQLALRHVPLEDASGPRARRQRQRQLEGRNGEGERFALGQARTDQRGVDADHFQSSTKSCLAIARVVLDTELLVSLTKFESSGLERVFEALAPVSLRRHRQRRRLAAGGGDGDRIAQPVDIAHGQGKLENRGVQFGRRLGRQMQTPNQIHHRRSEIDRGRHAQRVEGRAAAGDRQRIPGAVVHRARGRRTKGLRGARRCGCQDSDNGSY